MYRPVGLLSSTYVLPIDDRSKDMKKPDRKPISK